MVDINKITVAMPRKKYINTKSDTYGLPKVEKTSESLLESEFYESASHLIYEIIKSWVFKAVNQPCFLTAFISQKEGEYLLWKAEK